jgi:hypothetical protein
MASSNAEKQRRHRQRLKERGLVQVQGWVTPEQAEAIRRIMAGQATRAARVRDCRNVDLDGCCQNTVGAESQAG